MKNWMYFLTGLLFLSGCGSQHITLKDPVEVKNEVHNDGQTGRARYIKLTPGRSLDIKKDPTGRIYLVAEEGDKVTVQLGYRVYPVDKRIMDADMDYSLTMELDHPVSPGEWKDGKLKDIKAVYGFHAFHPDSGYYPVTEGSVRISVKKNRVVVEVNLPKKFGGEHINGIYEAEVK